MAEEYADSLRRWSDTAYYQSNVHKMQLPFTPAPKATPVDPEVVRQRRQELAKRLVEINRRKREQKVRSERERGFILCNAAGISVQQYTHASSISRFKSLYTRAAEGQIGFSRPGSLPPRVAFDLAELQMLRRQLREERERETCLRVFVGMNTHIQQTLARFGSYQTIVSAAAALGP